MNEKACMARKIYEFGFACHEMELYLDTHPDCQKALKLLKEYRAHRADAVAAYEAKYGRFITTVDDVEPAGRWQWIDSPWPWENNFLEG